MVAALAALAVAVPSASAAPTPRALAANPWGRDDPAGDASRSAGDLRRITVENGRQNVVFTFRLQAAPVWDTAGTSRATVMRFLLDWRGTTLAHDRRITVSRSDGGWNTVVFNGTGGAVCLANGGVTALGNHRYRFRVPVDMCLGGAHVLRASGSFADDRDDSALDDVRLDLVPNGGGYGPFIRLPA